MAGPIVVGIDFSDSSKKTLDQAAKLARADNSKLIITHVVDAPSIAELSAVTGSLESSLRQMVADEARLSLDVLTADIELPDHFEFDVSFGKPAVKLLERVRSASAPWLVLGGARKHSEAAGSVAIHCVKHSNSDVIITLPSASERSKVLVACMDFSAAAEGFIQQSAEIADRLGCEFHLLHVYGGPWLKILPRPKLQVPDEAVQARKKQLIENMHECVRRAVPESVQVAIDCHVKDHHSVAAGIADYVKQTHASHISLLAAGAGIRHAILGSVFHRCLVDMPCTVVALRSRAK